MDAPTNAQKMAAMPPNRAVGAFAPDGGTVTAINGPIAPERLIQAPMWIEWTPARMKLIEDVARKYPNRLPHGLAGKIAKEIGCAPKTLLNKLVEARKANRGEIQDAVT